MSAFAQLSIREKLLWLIVAASGLALVVVVAAAVLYEDTTFRPRALEQLQREASILGEVLQAPLTFHDSESAANYLATRRVLPEITVAAVYNRDGVLFAEYHRADISIKRVPAVARPAGAHFEARQLEFWQPLRQAGNLNGHLLLVRELPPLYARLPQYSITLGAVFLALLLVGTVLLRGVKHNLLRPLAALVRTADQVTRNNDYSVRAAAGQSDELGALARAFNQMLEAVGERDQALRAASEGMHGVLAAATEVSIIATDPHGMVTLFNSGAERLLGYVARKSSATTLRNSGAPPRILPLALPKSSPRPVAPSKDLNR